VGEGAADWAVAAYPENLTVGNMFDFLAVPTLVYQVGWGGVGWVLGGVGTGGGGFGLRVHDQLTTYPDTTSPPLPPYTTKVNYPRLPRIRRHLLLKWIVMFFCLGSVELLL